MHKLSVGNPPASPDFRARLGSMSRNGTNGFKSGRRLPRPKQGRYHIQGNFIYNHEGQGEARFGVSTDLYIIKLLSSGDVGRIKNAFYFTALTGIANAVLLWLINTVAGDTAAGKPIPAKMTVLYCLAVLIYTLASKLSLARANDIFQHQIARLRIELVDAIRESDILSLEKIGHSEIYAALIQESDYLSQNFTQIVGIIQSMFLVLFSVIYIATISQISFITLCFFGLLGMLIFWQTRTRLDQKMRNVFVRETAVMDSLTHFSEGFQEIRLNADKSDALFARFARLVEELKSIILSISRDWAGLLLFNNAYLYALLGIVILVLPMFFTGYSTAIYKIVTATIFCIGPLTGIFSFSHVYRRAEIGLGHVYGILDKLRSASQEPRSQGESNRFREFSRLSLEQLTFEYRHVDGTSLFKAGPWNLHFDRNELVFITGGNGAGKSTLMKLLCGLYEPESGSILLDGVPVTSENLQDYRDLFSAIFTDFHLFQRLYGLQGVDPDRVNELIAVMELSHKVSYAKGRFSTVKLSTGQRKRLALIVALLEDRPIMILDEWAADQDQHFREFFYRTLLPRFRDAGKTIIAVTHDDRYWSCADRLIKFEAGSAS